MLYILKDNLYYWKDNAFCGFQKTQIDKAGGCQEVLLAAIFWQIL
jgi:hypothetical protein